MVRYVISLSEKGNPRTFKTWKCWGNEREQAIEVAKAKSK